MQNIKKRVYIAGPYSSGDILKILDNIRKGIRAGVEVLLMGYAPFCPWLDHQFQFFLQGDEKLTVEHYREFSIAWLEVSDYMIVLDGWETSKGTIAEIAIAKANKIPTFYGVESFKEFFKAITNYTEQAMEER